MGLRSYREVGVTFGIVLCSALYLPQLSNAGTLQRTLILEHLSERHPAEDPIAERGFWNRAVAQDLSGLTQWIETERDPFRRTQLVQGLGWLEDPRAQQWLRDHGTEFKTSALQIATAVALGKANGNGLDAAQFSENLDANLDALEAMGQKSRSHGVKREVRNAVEALSQTALARGLALPSDHVARAWWKRLPEPEARAPEMVARPRFSRGAESGADSQLNGDARGAVFPVGKWKGEWMWMTPQHQIARARVELEGGTLRAVDAAPASGPAPTERRYAVTWQRDLQQLKLTAEIAQANTHTEANPSAPDPLLTLPKVWRLGPTSDAARVASEPARAVAMQVSGDTGAPPSNPIGVGLLVFQSRSQ